MIEQTVHGVMENHMFRFATVLLNVGTCLHTHRVFHYTVAESCFKLFFNFHAVVFEERPDHGVMENQWFK